MLEAFRQFIQDKKLCHQSDKILIAVSGGVDSIVLLDLFSKLGSDIAIAHCNFMLRGAESDGDAQFVRTLAEKYKVDYFQKSCDAGQYAEENKCSIQEAARELRYAWFEEICNKEGFRKIAVGQHLDDQIETFFINLFRGAGISGLRGMPEKRGKVIRPLLFSRRREIEQYARQNKLKFKEDSSNCSNKYLRNQIRHQLFPELKKIKAKSNDSILKSLKNLYDDDLILNQLLEKKRKKLIHKDDSTWWISIKKLNKLKPISTWLFYLLNIFGFSMEVTDQIAESLAKENSGKLFYSVTHQLLIDREKMFIRKNTVSDNEEYLINQNDSEIEKPIKLNLEKYTYDPTINLKKDTSVAFFDFDKLSFPLKIRKWKEGDRFNPFGMTGSKLVSDFLIDLKLSRFEKENIWLVLSGEHIIWIVGYRPSDDLKISDSTHRIFEIQLRN